MIRTLTLLHTNDLHSQYDAWLRVATVLRRRRAELQAAGHAVLVVDGGDHLDMSVPECMATGGRLNLKQIEELGYHAMAVGNNELIRFTPDQVRTLSTDSAVPWLLTNLREQDGSLVGGMFDRLLLDFGDGLKVGLTGITDLFGDLYESSMGLKNAPTADSVRAAAEAMRTDGATLVVLLSHAGYQQDLELALQISGAVDVIVGGHSHTVLHEPVTESGVVIAQAGSHGRFVGELHLELDEESGAIVRCTGELLPVE
jgi:5'-nucleotidase